MCLGVGAPGGIKTVTNEQGSAYGTAIDQAKAEFGDANLAFNDLMTSLAPIEKAGPNQPGWSAATASAINANTIDTTAAQYRNAAAAVRSGEAAVGGGNIALPSGANIGTETALAEAGAATEAAGLRENVIANYNQGNQNWKFATQGIQAAPSVFQTANAATNATTESGNAALKGQQVRASYPTWGSIAMGALGGALGNVDTTGSSSTGEQGSNLISGALGALAV